MNGQFLVDSGPQKKIFSSSVKSSEGCIGDFDFFLPLIECDLDFLDEVDFNDFFFEYLDYVFFIKK